VGITLAGSGATTGGASNAPQLAYAATAGNRLICFVHWNSSTSTPTAANGFALVPNTHVGNGAGGDQCALFEKVAAGDGSDGPSGFVRPCTLSASNTWGIHVLEYAVDDGYAWDSGADASDGQTDNANPRTSPSVTPTSGTQAVAVGGVYADAIGATPWSNKTIGGVAANARAEVGASGVSGSTFDRMVASTSGAYASSADANSGSAGGAVIGIFTTTSPASAGRVPLASYPRHQAPLARPW
jgi:hypothetical protein